MKIINIYTDGSSRGNPGPGGFGIILQFGAQVKELSQGFRRTTNNRMELLAVIYALENLKTNKYPVHILSLIHIPSPRDRQKSRMPSSA